jgi:hypothetical protein
MEFEGFCSSINVRLGSKADMIHTGRGVSCCSKSRHRSSGDFGSVADTNDRQAPVKRKIAPAVKHKRWIEIEEDSLF